MMSSGRIGVDSLRQRKHRGGVGGKDFEPMPGGISHYGWTRCASHHGMADTLRESCWLKDGLDSVADSSAPTV